MHILIQTYFAQLHSGMDGYHKITIHITGQQPDFKKRIPQCRESYQTGRKEFIFRQAKKLTC